MKFLLPLLVLALAAIPSLRAAASATNCGCACCEGKETCCCRTEPEEKPAAVRHPLRGVVVDILADRGALLVKHEEVPGVMRAMTMMFQVEPPVLEQVRVGDAIRALMSRDVEGRWWLHEVRPDAPAAAPGK